MTDDELKELVSKAKRLSTTALQAISDLQEVVAEISGKPTRRIPEQDVNGEPTWNYIVKHLVPTDIYVTKAFADYAAKWGFTTEQAEILMWGADPESGSTYEGFFKYYQRANTKWARWTLVWQKWVREQHARKQAKNGKATRFDEQRTRA